LVWRKISILHPMIFMDKLKELIFQYLDLITVDSKIYHMDNGSDWIINPKTKYWYVELEKSGECWLRYQVLEEIFMMFGLENADAQKIMGQWVEEVIKRGVVTTFLDCPFIEEMVEEVIKRGVVTTIWINRVRPLKVEEVIKRGVVTTMKRTSCFYLEVEEVIKRGVVTTLDSHDHLRCEVVNSYTESI